MRVPTAALGSAVDPARPDASREQSRARYPDEAGFVERDGVRVAWEAYGAGEPTVLLLPTWSIVHSRHWKLQIPYLARHYRVITFDGRGNGRSDRPADAAAYADTEFVADALAVLDATATQRAVLVGVSMGAGYALRLAAGHPERVEAAVFEAPALPFGDPDPERTSYPFDEPLERYEGWAKYNMHYWRHDYRDFLEFFFGQIFSEPHSTKQIEDGVGWGLETDAETLIRTEFAPYPDRDTAGDLAARVTCPCLVVHGTEDQIIPVRYGRGLAEALGAEYVELVGSGHNPSARDPVRYDLELRAFIDRVHPPTPRAPAAAPAPAPPPAGVAAPGAGTPDAPGADASGETGGGRRWVRGRTRRRRALYISSPIGLGHAQRDVAIADELRGSCPDLEIDWLAQHPVTEVLRARGERIHPASAALASESGHIESESGEHDLHCFAAWRRMDEILLANFMVFHDLVRDDPYDLWIGDEAWELDYYLHENPELKAAAYVWLTDFVGWLPMPDGGEREAFLTADYNAEMIGHIARFPRVRDRAIFVGNPDDIVPDRFGPGLPRIRDWTEAHYDFAGYVTGFDPAALGDPEALRAELGYRPDEQVCIVAVGGSGVGAPLLRRITAAFPEAKRLVPDLRMVIVAGPRIDPDSVVPAGGAPPDLEVRPYVHELYRHLAAADLAIVQGGLTTTMELVANRRPFLYFPLRHHFEQNFHVRHRLERYDAGRPMDFDAATPEVIAGAIAAEIGTEPPFRPVETDGAARAARLIAPLL